MKGPTTEPSYNDDRLMEVRLTPTEIGITLSGIGTVDPQIAEVLCREQLLKCLDAMLAAGKPIVVENELLEGSPFEARTIRFELPLSLWRKWRLQAVESER